MRRDELNRQPHTRQVAAPRRPEQVGSPPPIPKRATREIPTPPPIRRSASRLRLVASIGLVATCLGLWAAGFGSSTNSNDDPFASADSPPAPVAEVNSTVQTPETVPTIDPRPVDPRPVDPLPNAGPNPTGHFVLSSLDLSGGANGTGAACSADRTLGTSMAWATSPQAAFTSAQRNNKLVYLIHVSGNFEQPGFT